MSLAQKKEKRFGYGTEWNGVEWQKTENYTHHLFEYIKIYSANLESVLTNPPTFSMNKPVILPLSII